VAVVSYLKTQAPVHNQVPPHKYSVLGRIVRATILANPVGPKATPLKASPRGATVENGRYLVESVGLCSACHTQRDERTYLKTVMPVRRDVGPPAAWVKH
jgi:hypothetical protein